MAQVSSPSDRLCAIDAMSAMKFSRRLPHETRFTLSIEHMRNGCWEWRKARTVTAVGYGLLMVNGKRMLAHRYAYERFVGPIPAGHVICHKCDNPGCVNPEHLFVGTSRDNVDDMLQKRERRMFETPVRWRVREQGLSPEAKF